MTITVGEVAVSVVPSAQRFAPLLRQQVLPDADRIGREVGSSLADGIARGFRDGTTSVRDDITRLSADLDRLGAKSPSIKVDLQDTGAKAGMDALLVQSDRLDAKRINIQADADTGAARANLAALDAEAGSSAGGIGALGLAGIALGPAIVPVAAACVAAIAGIGTAATGALAGFGVLAAAVAPIVGAVQSLSQADEASASNAAQAAQAARTKANAIASANSQIQSSEASLTNARVSAAQGVASAQQQVVSAEQSLANAQVQAKQAQDALTDARKSAAQQLEDYNLQLADGALAQRAAQLAIEQAKQNLDSANSNAGSTQLQRQQAQLAYDQAVQHNTDLGVQQQRLKAEADAANKAGVEGSKQVVAAKQQVESANQGVSNSEQAVERAQAAVAEAQRKGAAQIAAAQLSVANAQRSLATAQEQASTAGVSGANKVADAFKGLTPAGAEFARFIYGLKDSFGDISKAAQNGLLPGVESFIKGLLPLVPPLSKFVGELAKTMGDLFAEAGKALQSPFWQQFAGFLAQKTPEWMTTLAHTAGDIVTGLAGLFQALSPLGDLFNASFAAGAKAFADWATNLSTNSGFQSFLGYVRDNLPPVLKFFGDLFALGGKLVQALAPVGPVVLQVVDGIARFLADLSPSQLLAVAGGIAGIFVAFQAFSAVPKLLEGVSAALGFLTGPVGLVVLAIAGLAAGIIYLYQTNDTFRDKVNAAWAAIQEFAVTRVIPAVQGIIDAIQGFVSVAVPIVQQFVDGMRTRIEPLMPQIKAIFGTIGDIIVDALNLIAAVISAVTAVISAVWNAWGQGIMDWVALVFKNSLNTISAVLDTIKGVIHLFTDILHGNWSAAWQDVQDIVSGAFRAMQSATDTALAILGKALSTAWDAIKAVAGTAWQGVVDTIGGAWNNVVNAVKGPINDVIGLIDSLIDKVNAILPDGVKIPTIPKLAGGGPVIPFGSAGRYAVGGLIHGPGGPTDDQVPIWASPGEWVIRASSAEALGPNVMAAVNNADRNANHTGVMDALFGAGNQQQFAVGGEVQGGNVSGQTGTQAIAAAMAQVSDVVNSCLAVVQNWWASGHAYPTAYAQWQATGQHPGDTNPPLGAPVFFKGANPAGHVAIYAGNGMVRSTDAPTAGRVGTVPLGWFGPNWGHQYLGWGSTLAGSSLRFDGNPDGGGAVTGGDSGSGGTWYGSLAKTLFDAASGPAMSAIHGITGAIGGLPGTAVDAIITHVHDGIGTRLANLGSSSSDGSGSGAGSGVTRWTDVVLQALALEGQSASLLGSTLRRMNQESGGNPNAVNNWDSNAKAGTPSKGLMQVIDPTFAAYHDPRLSGNIFDPEANIAASMRYAVARYGSLTSAYDRAGGYASGGMVKPLLFDAGGYLPQGISMVSNQTGAPEPLMRADGAGATVHVHVAGSVVSEGDLVRKVRDGLARRADRGDYVPAFSS